MAKLGIIINTTFEGKSEAYSANSSEWSNEVRDIRTLLEQVQGVAENEIPLLLTYAKDGVFLVLIKSIYGRGGDNISAWIHIPSNINIAGKEVEEIVNHVSKSISGTKLETDSLDELFSREYETEIAKHIVDVPTNEKIAIREYKGDTIFQIELSTLLDSKYLFQPVYSQYKYVFLVDNKKSRLTCPTGTKLKDANVVESVIVRPVEDKDGFSLFYRNEKFTTSFFAYKAEKLTFVWKRAGYKDVDVVYEVKEGCPIPTISRKDYKKYVNFTSITVRDKETRKRLSDYSVTVLGKSLTEDIKLAVSLDTINDAEVVVKAAGYNTYERKLDLSSPVILDLEPKTYTYRFRFETKDGDKLEATVVSKGLLKHTPFQGYHSLHGHEPYERDVNDIIYDPLSKEQKRKSWIIRLICFVVGLVLGVFGAAYVANNTIENLESQLSSAKKGHTTYATPTQQEASKQENDPYADIIKYMDTNIKWNKSELDKHPQIHGLWDALNEYKFDEIERFKEPLKKSTKFTELMSAIEKDSKTRADYGDSYNTNKDDLDITIDNYIKKIKSEKQAKPAPTKKPDEKKDKSKEKKNQWEI